MRRGQLGKFGTSTRRHFLRGAGVALALPWLESLAPRRAHGDGLAKRRFVAMSFPNGVGSFWAPTGTGAGNAWKLSPIMEPLAPIKSKVSVLSHVGNYSPWGGHVEPSHSSLTGAFLSCTRASGTFADNGGVANGKGGTSVDQVLAQAIGSATRVPSLQVGLSTLDSSTDGLPGPHSRSISWAAPDKPLFKIVDPQKVFDQLFGVVMPKPETRAADTSILDAVLAQASSLQPALSRSDRVRLDEFLTSVRTVEMDINGTAPADACKMATRPTESYDVGKVPAGYSRDKHADIMIDLVALALQCDVTRVVSFMFDDSRSDFVYSFMNERLFTATGSTQGTAPVGSLHGLASSTDTNNGWATTTFWFVSKVARLCQKMMAVQEPAGSVLDQSVVWLGSEMHGLNHDGLDLPLLYVGSGGGRLKVDQRFDFAGRARQSEDLANVYFTFLQKVFDLPVQTFGKGQGDFIAAGSQVVPEILV